MSNKMDAKHTPLCRVLATELQFVVPIYQRKYSWRMDECKKLLEDIIRASKKNDDDYYFIGSLVYVTIPTKPGENPRYIVIDGQQRITTILLILIALEQKLDRIGQQQKIKEKIHDYVINRHEDGEKRYKLVLTPSDKGTMQSIVDDDGYDETSAILKNNFELIKEYIENLDPIQIYNGLEKLMVVNIILEEKDRPQLVFESINSTGLQLTKTDLIRNYILMDLPIEQQENIYNKYWRPMEENFENYRIFDEFMKDFLTIKNKENIKIEKIYEQFKKWHFEQDVGIEEIIKDVKNHSEFFIKMVLDWKEENTKLRRVISNINKLKMSVMRPFLLKCMILHQEEKITQEQLLEIFIMVESYTFRRAICRIPQAGLNKLVPQFISEIDKITNDFFNEIIAILFAQNKRYRFPDNSEFEEHFKDIDIYNTKIVRYALFRLENMLRSYSKEHPWLEDKPDDRISIEHIMPKNTSAWRECLSDSEIEEAGKYIHTIGNLTLTGYNSELSDNLFSEKMNMEGGFKSSQFLLSKDITGAEWKEKQIINRANNLTKKAIMLWKRVEPPAENLKKYLENNLQIYDDEYTEEEYFDGEYTPDDIMQSTKDLFDHIKDRISDEFKELEYRPQKMYCGFYIGKRNVCSLQILKNSINLFYNTKNEILPKNKFVKHLIKEDGTRKRHWGNGDFMSNIKNNNSVEEAIPFIKKILDTKISDRQKNYKYK